MHKETSSEQIVIWEEQAKALGALAFLAQEEIILFPSLDEPLSENA